MPDGAPLVNICSMTLSLALLLALLPQAPSTNAQAAPAEPPKLMVSGPDGEMVVLGPLGKKASFLAPFTTFDDAVQRAGLKRGLLLLAVNGDAQTPTRPNVIAVVHERDEIVALTRHTFGVFSGLTLPKSAQAGGSVGVEALARRDYNYLTGKSIRIEAPDDGLDGLLLFGSTHDTLRGESPTYVPIEANSEVGVLTTDATAPFRLAWATAEDGSYLPAPKVITVESSSEILLDAAYFVRQVTPAGVFALVAPTEAASAPGTWSYAFPQSLRQNLDEKAITLVIQPGGTLTTKKESTSAANSPGTTAPKMAANETVDLGPLSAYTTSASASSLRALSRGLDFIHFEGEREQLDIRPTMGPGAAWGDLNADGFLDLVVLQGGGRNGVDPLPDRVWLSGPDGNFRDVTKTAGLGAGDAGMGALLVDLNGDGALDLYCANYGKDRLYLGKGDGTFTDATEELPGHDLWSASVTAGDPDGDGDLDLYITSYLDYDLTKTPPAEELGRYQRDDPVEMLPFAFPGQRNVFLRNTLAQGKFGLEDATEELGLLDATGRGMQAVFWDFDHDGDDDLYIANDVSPNVLFRNEGDGSFKDVSFSTGLDDPRGGMGLALGDVDQDGDEDMFLTNWELESNALYLNGQFRSGTGKRRRSSFHDSTVKSGLGPSGIGKTSWGAELFDLELDGDLDLYIANGYTSPDYESTGICVGQTDLLFVGNGEGRFKNADALAAEALSRAYASRGAIGADYDRDGDIDLVVTANNGPLQLLTNESQRAGHWLGIQLRQASPNAYGIGAVVEVTTSDGRTRRATLRAGQGYLTGNPPELHFGLGPVESVESVKVTWPDGETQTFEVEMDGWRTLARIR